MTDLSALIALIEDYADKREAFRTINQDQIRTYAATMAFDGQEFALEEAIGELETYLTNHPRRLVDALKLLAAVS